MIDHFSYGLLTPVIAYTVSVIGSFVGLMFAARTRTASGATRWTWLTLGAVCLGGTAVWSMHFIAMLGFQISGAVIRYDTTLAVASGLLAIAVMGVTLYLTTTRRTGGSLLLGGLITGVAVVSTHYTGMASINMHGELHHDPLYGALAGAVAVVAATIALWLSLRLRGVPAILLASLIMGAAVTGMHYTGMIGMHVTLIPGLQATPVEGATTSELLLPLLIGLFVFLMVCSLLLMLDVDDTDARRVSSKEDRAAPAESGEDDDEHYNPRHRSPDSYDPWERRR
ncbi:MHYT domain-containing protein [Nocardiopsis sp. ATB16-24]|uniref:MHYT domain-containing protein n=1 Tax=Nocardiopsis sp. ATB16-24 TaxID=3019555 RepID=UPI0025567EF1|nr:MHYT domain-containing protein [Nocardiopsis sp. ATB16-24]